MRNIQINAKELRKALKDIEQAEKNGFMYCEAVFSQITKDDYWAVGKYSDLWEKAHPTNGGLDWGRGQDVTKHNTFKDGKVIPTEERKKEIENYPASEAIESGKILGYKYWIVPNPVVGLNGYIAFPKRPVKEKGYMGILTYVPVHGGITYAKKGKFGMVYGFDTVHCDSDKYPRDNKKWIKKQIIKMIRGIEMAAKKEKNYLNAKTKKTKAKYAQMVLDTDRERENQYNFGIGINILSGKL